MLKDPEEFKQAMLSQTLSTFNNFLYFACKVKKADLGDSLIADIYCEKISELTLVEGKNFIKQADEVIQGMLSISFLFKNK